jgi:hypothetical protein
MLMEASRTVSPESLTNIPPGAYAFGHFRHFPFPQDTLIG